MDFPGDINGPKFSEGDIVTFTLPEAELTMRLPVVADYKMTDRVSNMRDLTNVDTSSWEHFGDDGFCFDDVAVQSWKYEDLITHDNVASCFLCITLEKHGNNEAESLFSLNSQTFREQQLEWIAEDSGGDTRPGWPNEENNFFAKTLKKEMLDGLQVEVERVSGGGETVPNINAVFSLGKHFSMRIDFSLSSLHYPDRKNPYSEEFLQDLKFKLFDDFISHIHIKYTPETIALIEQRTKELSA